MTPNEGVDVKRDAVTGELYLHVGKRGVDVPDWYTGEVYMPGTSASSGSSAPASSK